MATTKVTPNPYLVELTSEPGRLTIMSKLVKYGVCQIGIDTIQDNGAGK